MLLRLCQLKSLWPLFLLFSCATPKSQEEQPPVEMLTLLDTKWYKVNEQHSLQDVTGKIPSHLFFDVIPEFSNDYRMVNVIITTPQDSDHHYRLDLSSGQRHYAFSYCKQTDVWNRFSGTLHHPPFSTGYIPRVLDQLGEAQKVLVFGDTKQIKKTMTYNRFRLKIFGAYVEQFCIEGNCLGKANWLSRMVFLAIDPGSKRYGKVNTIAEFKNIQDWDEVKAHIENMEGRNVSGEHTFPYIRASNPIGYEEALDYFRKRSIFMSEGETKKIQSGCHALYERLWTDVGDVRPEDRPVWNVEELKERVKIRQELRSKRMPVGFAERFRVFTTKYANEMGMCGKFVYRGNVNLAPEKFWFLAHMGIFFQLHKDGYVFDCRQKNWKRNVMDTQGKVDYDIKKDILDCNEKDLDLAMSYLPNFLKGLRANASSFYKFVDYDNHSHGTHNKLYSWVKMPSKKFSCENDPNLAIKKDTQVFPEDVQWKERFKKDAETEMKIIY